MTRRSAISTILSCLLLAAHVGFGQSGALPTAAELQAQRGASAKLFAARMPSLTCHETATVQELKKGEVKKETHVESTIRVTRTTDDHHPFVESHHFDAIDGVPTTQGKKINVAYWVDGAFANGNPALTNQQAVDACSQMRVESDPKGKGWLLISDRKPGTDDLPICQEWSIPGLHRDVLLDREGHVLQVIRTLPPEVAQKYKDAMFAAIDYAPVVLGDETLWLPARMQSHNQKDDRRLDVRYSECKRFTGTVKILDGMEKVPE